MYNYQPEWFLLDLPPINLYTANLLMPYYNGVEEIRIEGITQPMNTKRTETVLQAAKDLVESHNGKTSCVKLCKLDRQTQCCTGCGRSIEEITNAGIAAKAANKQGELND